MYIIVLSSTTNNLVASPETGMGYQILELGRRRDEVAFILVENAQVVTAAWTVIQESPAIHLGRKTRNVYTSQEEQIRAALEAGSFKVLTHSAAVQVSLVESRSMTATKGPAAEASIEKSGDGERFLRYSAFKNDRRLTQDGSVVPGTYVATYEDGTMYVRTGMDAVRRYALPNREPAVHQFHLRPPKSIPIRRGIVAPANEQPGGGAEAIFVDGAPAGTVLSQMYVELPRGD